MDIRRESECTDVATSVITYLGLFGMGLWDCGIVELDVKEGEHSSTDEATSVTRPSLSPLSLSAIYPPGSQISAI